MKKKDGNVWQANTTTPLIDWNLRIDRTLNLQQLRGCACRISILCATGSAIFFSTTAMIFNTLAEPVAPPPCYGRGSIRAVLVKLRLTLSSFA